MDCDLIIPKYSLLDTKRGEYAEEIAQLYCETIDMNRVKKQEEFENMFAQVLYYQVSNLTTACVDWDNNLIGAISYGFYRDCEPTCGRVFKIAVQPQYQRGGVGRELLSYAESCLAG
ncbi:GNAT family N-acetyltransferase, partial [Candidatus Saccharibacteria bacterium]|nr:GNAT family N-acetyltransferase [Candidatus Saccharibacteria bacterium]